MADTEHVTPKRRKKSRDKSKQDDVDVEDDDDIMDPNNRYLN